MQIFFSFSGIDPEVEQNAFSKKKTIGFSSPKKTVKIVDNDEILSKVTTCFKTILDFNCLFIANEQS